MKNFIPSIRPKRQLNLLIAATFASLQLMIAFAVVGHTPLVNALAEHCPGATDENSAVSVPLPEGYTILVDNDSNDPSKIDGSTLTLPEGTLFCVKAGPEASGILTMGPSGYEVTWTVGQGGATPGISYYMVYQLTQNGEEEEEDKVTLCHATGSETNPFVKITVAAAGAFNGHLGNDHQNGEDIIPPFTFNGQTHSQNWDAEGQALFNNNCVAKEDEEEEREDGGVVLGETTRTTTPAGAQAIAAVGGVGAGFGGGVSSITTSAFGLATSLGALGYGAASLLRRKSLNTN